ncbi:MAG: hypothetical protein ACOC35_14910 [Promethearchaeia archaeon]
MGRIISFIEILMLEVSNLLSEHGVDHFLVKFIRSTLKDHWCGRVVSLNMNIPVETKFLPS